MSKIPAENWEQLSDIYGFLGNSLLKPMNQTATTGLDPAFWDSFPPVFENEETTAGLQKLKAYATEASIMGEDKAVQDESVEYTHLFIGPPSPAAPPWETMNKEEGVTIGFGQATFDMREILRVAGLELSNDNRQYEDHIGIELLYLSHMSREYASETPSKEDTDSLTAFINTHPLSWIAMLREKVEEVFPDGYISGLLLVAEGTMKGQIEALAND